MGSLNMKKKKWNKLDKSKRSSCSPVVFKHDCSLETSGALEKNKQYSSICIFLKLQDNSDTDLDFKKWLQVFLLNGSFGDTEFCYFLLTNHDTMVLSE